MTLPNFYSIFGRKLAAARKARDLTQAQLAEAASLSRASIANIEAGKQRVFLDQVYEFSSALGLSSPRELLPEFIEKRPDDRSGLRITGATNLSREQERALGEALKEAIKR